MKSPTIVSTALAALLATALLHGNSSNAIQLPPPQWTMPIDAPPEMYWGENHKAVDRLDRGNQQGALSWSTKNKSVEISWSTLPDNPIGAGSSTSWDNFMPLHSGQTFLTRFYTTNILALSSELLIVAGLDPNSGKTVIEAWTLEWPSVMPTPAYNSSTGQTEVKLVTPTRTGVRTLYSEKDSGKTIVRELHPFKALNALGIETSPAILIQFHDSRELHKLELVSSQLTLVASPSVPVGTMPPIPTLLNPYVMSSNAHHSTYGYVYTFQTKEFFPRPGTTPLTIFADTNKDGVLDQVFILAPEAWPSSPFGDVQQYVSW